MAATKATGSAKARPKRAAAELKKPTKTQKKKSANPGRADHKTGFIRYADGTMSRHDEQMPNVHYEHDDEEDEADNEFFQSLFLPQPTAVNAAAQNPAPEAMPSATHVEPVLRRESPSPKRVKTEPRPGRRRPTPGSTAPSQNAATPDPAIYESTTVERTLLSTTGPPQLPTRPPTPQLRQPRMPPIDLTQDDDHSATMAVVKSEAHHDQMATPDPSGRENKVAALKRKRETIARKKKAIQLEKRELALDDQDADLEQKLADLGE